MNLADALAGSAAGHPDRPALVFRGRRITYRELDAETSRVAASLLHMGVDAGDRVAIWLPNLPAFVSLLYGAWRVGAIVVPVHTMLTPHEARYVLEDSGARILVCSEPHYSETALGLQEDLPALEQVVVVGEEPGPAGLSFASLLDAGTGAFPPVELTDDHLALIQYTSGTSGLPKGAMLSHRNLRANVEQMLATPIAPGGEDVTLCVLPLFHIYGLNVVLNLSITVGATIVLYERFDPLITLGAIRDHSVTQIAAAPPVYVAWLLDPSARPEDFSSVRVAVSGAAPLPADALTGFGERFKLAIWEGYGMTETGPALTSTAVGGKAKPGSIGRPLPGIELRLVAEDDEEAEAGDPGEVHVRGPNVFSGYWQRPQETAAVFRDGWFRTGDVAVADEDGDLFIVDRRADLIIVSGFNVYPKEVEDVLLTHPKVVDCAVIGVGDVYQGEQVKAYVVLGAGAEASEDELTAFCATRLAAFKVPRTIEVVREIPRNAAGKVLRRELRGVAAPALDERRG